jgi:hypothetical protein
MYPQQSISENLLILHDMECDGEFDCDERRQERLTFSDELDEVVEVTRSARVATSSSRLTLEESRLATRQEIAAQLTLGELPDTAWDVITNCTGGTENWMSDWYATHVLIKLWIGEADKEKLLIRCVRGTN